PVVEMNQWNKICDIEYPEWSLPAMQSIWDSDVTSSFIFDLLCFIFLAFFKLH
ncbi:hypothetical protein ACJX0J_024809, partial [Zea mays]